MTDRHYNAGASNYHLGELWAHESDLFTLYRVTAVTCEPCADGAFLHRFELTPGGDGQKRFETRDTFPVGWCRATFGAVVRNGPAARAPWLTITEVG